MEKLNITIADNNPILLQQLADTIINESYSKGIDYIFVNPNEAGVLAGKVDKIQYMIESNENRSRHCKNVEAIITEKLNRLGIPASLKGYRYMITGIREVLKDETVLEGVTKVLYPGIAKKHNSTPQRVEKAIRHAIEVAWNRNSSNESKLKQKFQYLSNPHRLRPTNSEFIAVISQNIKMEL